MKLWIVIGTLLMSLTAFSQDSVSVAIQSLSNSNVFAFGGTGYAGKRSDGEKNFRVLMTQPREIALSTFEQLFSSGNPQAKAYALAGIKKLDRDRFKQLRMSLKSSNEIVTTMSGCVVEEMPLSKVTDMVDQGAFDGYLRQ